MILYIAGLQTIPKDVLEAAKLDGCVGLKIRYIEIPLLMTTVTVNLFVSIANSFKAFDIPFALTGGGPEEAHRQLHLIFIMMHLDLSGMDMHPQNRLFCFLW